MNRFCGGRAHPAFGWSAACSDPVPPAAANASTSRSFSGTKDHADLTPLLGPVCCFGAATISALLGLSPAYGAFLAGLTIGNSDLRVGMLEMVMPIQSVLMMVFFLSIGLLIDLSLIWDNIGIILLMLLIVTVGKTASFAALRIPWAQALLTALILAQVGEFSFLLGNVGLQRGIISSEEFRIILSVTALSLVIAPLNT